ncbi:MAG: cell division protein FtsZ [Chloroflexota bacterium]
MKLLVIGCGLCGGRIAEHFAALGRKARAERHIEIVTDSLVVTTSAADFDGLSPAADEILPRIILGYNEVFSREPGETNELAAEIAREDSERVIEAVEPTLRSGEMDAFMLIAAAAGGTGSGLIPALTRSLKEHCPNKPAYNLIVLPFVREEIEKPVTVYNASACLKSVYLAADAVFLVDNQRYFTDNASPEDTLNQINETVVAPFYNLLCAGEERSPANIGGKVLDAGDIIQSLAGWTVVGRGTDRKERKLLGERGRALFPGLGLGEKHPVGSQLATVEKGVRLVSEALDELSLDCNPQEAVRACYLLTAPPEAMHISLLKELGGSLKRVAPEATIRGGDYPRRGRAMELSLILSELGDVGRVTELFSKAIDYMAGDTTRRKRKASYSKPDEEAFGRIPLLL